MNDEQQTDRSARRETLRRLAALGTLGAAGHFTLIRESLAAGSLPATPGFRFIKGPVGVDEMRASIGMNIKPGQTVMTGVEGEAVYIIGPDAFLQHEKTKIRFDDNLGAQVMRLIQGRVLCTFGKGHERPRNLQLVTQTATIGIRGTGCYLETDAEKTLFCLCYGEAQVMPKGDPNQMTLVQSHHHDRPIIIRARGDALIEAAQIERHDDQQLIMLDNAVGRWPPFYDPQKKALR